MYEICYPDMPNTKMTEIDLEMDHRYKAMPSIVTDNTWVRTAPGTWVKAYCSWPAANNLPTLYVVHYSVPYRKFVVYRNLPPEEAPCISAAPAGGPSAPGYHFAS